MTPTQRNILIGVAAAILIGLGLWWWLRKDLSGQIVVPYISHQQPIIDPHLPDAVALSDKLDEVLFEGLFNISANPSGVVYEDALGELIDVTDENDVIIRLKSAKKWHSSFKVVSDDDEVTITEEAAILFTAADLNFTLNRIKQLGSLSPDYILLSQALESFSFTGPDRNNEIRFRFKADRDWKDDEIKDILAFKILPASSDLAAGQFLVGTGPYLAVNWQADISNFYRSPAGQAVIPAVNLKPYIDNSTFTTEFKNTNFNVLLETPFGSKSPILEDPEDFFVKSNISTSFFAVLFNTQRLNLEQRRELRKLFNNKAIIDRFYKTGTPQQRHIVDYKGNNDNYADYLNYSVYPSSSYYVEEEIIIPQRDATPPSLSVLPDSITVAVSLDHGHREEFTELVEILNDPSISGRKIRAVAVDNNRIKQGDYDAVLVSIDGYKSTFAFDLYSIFLREPDLAQFKLTLRTGQNARGETVAEPASLVASNNFCRLDATASGPDQEAILKFLENVYGFMSSDHVGDRQIYAQMVDQSEYDLALGSWLFSLPSLAYFSTQFDALTINLYGVASQLSTIEKWQERRD